MLVTTKPHQPLAYVGWDHAQEQFANLGMSWQSLREIVQSTGKPAADLGSCYSPYPVEARTRGIPVVPIDPRYRGAGDGWLRNVATRLRGYDPELQSTLAEAALHIEGSRLAKSAAQLSELPERSFSIITSHKTVPEHTRDLEQFLSGELPAILRCAAHSVRLYPFAIYRENEQGELTEAAALYRDSAVLRRVRDLAALQGYSVHFEREACAVFSRVPALEWAHLPKCS